jgi:hypothetical protein
MKYGCNESYLKYLFESNIDLKLTLKSLISKLEIKNGNKTTNIRPVFYYTFVA